MAIEHGLIRVDTAYEQNLPEKAILFTSVAGLLRKIKHINYTEQSGYSLTVNTRKSTRRIYVPSDTLMLISYTDLSDENAAKIYNRSRIVRLPLRAMEQPITCEQPGVYAGLVG